MSKRTVDTTRHVIRSTLDLSAVDTLDRDLPLKVAALSNGKVLASEIVYVKDAKDVSAIPFKLTYDTPPRTTPLGVTVAVGPDVPDDEFVGVDTYKQKISPKDAAWDSFKYKFERLVIPPHIYPWWLRWCRKYTIRGKVVCPDGSPVPGAKVEAFDVDRCWIWCGTSSVGSGVTELDGTFEITFRWCCYWWWWWLPLPLRPIPPKLKVPPPPVLKRWEIDPYLAKRVEALLQKVPEIGPVPRPDPAPSMDQLQTLSSELALAFPDRKAAMPTTGPKIGLDALGKSIVQRLPDAPELRLLHVWPFWPWHDCAPDIIFKVTQDCNALDTVIYEESCADTRWGIPSLLDGVTLIANDDACCVDDEDPPDDDCFIFGKVGCTPVDMIGGNDPLAPVPASLLGYADPNGSDHPFGGNLAIDGVYGSLTDIDCYAIEHSIDGVIFNEMTGDMLANFSRKYWGEPPGGGPAQWNTVLFKRQEIDGHWVYMARQRYESDNPCNPPPAAPIQCWEDRKTWTYNKYRLLTWISDALPDGLYHLRVVGFNINPAGHLKNPRVMTLCNTQDEARLIIRIDNRNIGAGYHAPSTASHPCGEDTIHACTEEPDCDFTRVVVNEGGDEKVISPCDIVRLNPADTVTIHFNASVPPTVTDGHLAGYQLTAHYGESGYFNVLTKGSLAGDPDPQFGPTYAKAVAPPQNAPRPLWFGGNFKVTLTGSDFPKCCAYLLRLRAWKRTNRGCGNEYYFHYNICEYSFTVLKPELCPDICPPPIIIPKPEVPSLQIERPVGPPVPEESGLDRETLIALLKRK